MIKVLGLALYGTLAASTRYRLCQYIPGLARQGIDLQIRSLLGDGYLRRTFSGKRAHWPSLLRSGLRRLSELVEQREYDAVVLHCELFPLVPGWLETTLVRKPYVYDFDDAFYLKYKTGRLRSLEPLLGNKFDSVIRNATVVTAGSRVLSDYAKPHNPNTQYLPTVVDMKRYVPNRHSRENEFVVGWIGSPSTSAYLSELVAPLSVLGRDGTVRLVVIGGPAPAIPGVTVEAHKWSEETEIALINGFDVGVMPLPDSAWARGKCAFKLIQYMACGLPAITSPVGANIDVIQPGHGFLARTADDWLNAFRLLRDQPARAREMGMAARVFVAANYSLDKNLPIFAQAIRATAEKGT